MRDPVRLGLLLALCAAPGCSTLEDWQPDAGPRCDGGRCPEPDAGLGCSELNPQGCTSDAACGPGQRCVRSLSVCLSSGCACDELTGKWACLPDCGGGSCQPAP